MNSKSLTSRLEQLGCIVLSDRERGVLRVVESLRLLFCDVVFKTSLNEDQIIARVESFLSGYGDRDSNQNRMVNLSLHVVHEAVDLDGIDSVLATVATILGSDAAARIVIYSNQRTFDYTPIIRLVKSLRNNVSVPKEVGILLVAPFGEYRGSEMETLFNLGVRLKYAAGWISKDLVPSVETDVLCDLSELGFCVPIEWYVCKHNIKKFESEIQYLLGANYSGGFSLPLVSRNPYYRFASGFPALPNELAYCRLLTRTYERYPHCDEMFYPLNALALLVKQGGWHSRLHIPATMDLLLDEKGHIGVFRQSPALKQHWMDVSRVATTSVDNLRNHFLQFANETRNWKSIPYCRDCCWRNICGGHDLHSRNYACCDVLHTMCGYRKLFLEHFASIRPADCVVGET